MLPVRGQAAVSTAGGRSWSGSFEQIVERVWGSGLLFGVPGDVQVVELELPEVPQDVVPSAEQHQFVHGGGAAVGAVAQVVGVAHGGWSGAAAGDAVQVAGSEVPSLSWRDRVSEGLAAGDLADRAEQDAGDAGVAQQRLDAACWSAGRSRRRWRRPAQARRPP
jgi:hypothetical protein